MINLIAHSLLAAVLGVELVAYDRFTIGRLIETIQPDEIAGGAAVRARGGEVKVLGFEDGVSTTAMIATILDREG